MIPFFVFRFIKRQKYTHTRYIPEITLGTHFRRLLGFRVVELRIRLTHAETMLTFDKKLAGRLVKCSSQNVGDRA